MAIRKARGKVEIFIQADLMDKISIVIRNRNESDYIGFCLQSIREYLPKSEVIIIDNESSDDSLEVVKLFSKDLDIQVLTLARNIYSPGRSINLGASNASHPLVLVLSAHCRLLQKPDLHFVSQRLKTYVAVFGNQIPIYRGKKITKRYIWQHFGDTDVIDMFSQIENRPFLHNAFCFYNREFLLAHPFDEEYSGKEDRYWAFDMIQKGKSYYYASKLRVEHFWTVNGATWKGLG